MAKKKSSKKVQKKSAKASSYPAQSKHHDAFRDEIIHGSEKDYDKLFEHKLAEQYRMFRDLREHRIQIRKLVRVLVIIAILALLSLLLLSFG